MTYAATVMEESGDTQPQDRSGQGVGLDDRYLNRELSVLAFQQRVLANAQDRTRPLFERITFLTIVTSNLDEFFMIRVAGLKQQLAADVCEPSSDGRLPHEVYGLAHTAAQELQWKY